MPSRRLESPLLLGLSCTALAALLPAQRARDLQVRDLFLLDWFLVAPREEPRGWIDGGRYLAFDGGRPGAAGTKTWYAVEARTGRRTPLVERGPWIAALVEASGQDAGAVGAAVGEAEHWVWNRDHSLCALAMADDLFARAADGKALRLCATPEPELEPSFAPDGSRLAFVRNGDLYTVPAAGGAEARLTEGGGPRLLHGRLDWVYQEEVYGRGKWRGYWWSPDSARIAFLRLDESGVAEYPLVADEPAVPELERNLYPKTGGTNPKAALGVVAAAGGEARWFDLSRHGDQETLIVRVTWAPDSRAVVFQVQDRAQTWLDVLAGDPESGKVELVFREESDCWVEPGPEPHWIGDGAEFLWLSERDGFRHAYRYRRDGKLLGRLTEGPWEVKEIEAVDAEAGQVWFTADKADVKGVQLFSVSLQGGEPKQVTAGEGTHDVEFAPDRALFLDTWSSARSPESIAVHAADGAPVRTVARPRPELLEPFGLSAPEFVQVKARDGFVMEAMLIKPRGFEAGKRYPVLQQLYAGPHAPAVRDRWGHRDYLWHQLLAQHGFLVFLCDNRSASGKGRAAHKACWRNLGQSELRDLEDAADWLVQQGLADPARLGLWGWSYGGYQTLFNLTHSTKWKLGIAVNAVTDWRLYDTIYTERYHGLPGDNAAAYEASSVLPAAGSLHGELLLVTAALDDNVHMQNSLQLAHALQKAGKQFRFMVYPRVRHGIEDLEQQMHLFTMLTGFVQEKL